MVRMISRVTPHFYQQSRSGKCPRPSFTSRFGCRLRFRKSCQDGRNRIRQDKVSLNALVVETLQKALKDHQSDDKPNKRTPT
jgi:hypothetical protein